MKPQFLIAAPHSGAGKTTLTLGILRALHNRGLNVQPFKCGPDYLDPKLHLLASGKQSINLDRFMMPEQHLLDTYASHSAHADVVVTEGVMGLFDGAVKMEGSSADIACLLDIPVILVVNAKAMAYSAAALLLGFKLLSPAVQLAGVIFNFVSSESHYRILKEAAADAGITPLGFLPPNAAVAIPSRHLGLQTENNPQLEQVIAKAAMQVEEHIDLDQLLAMTSRSLPHQSVPQLTPEKQGRRIAIARDAAFNFLYPENVKALATLGEISYFSPLTDTQLPTADLVYLPGGYPELHLEALSANKEMHMQLQQFFNNGGRILAECGGMMYLGTAIVGEDGKSFPMTGILPVATTMQQKKLSLGYKRLQIKGITLSGHEFHYSSFLGLPPVDQSIQVWNARNEQLQLPVFYQKNLLASYFHLYWADRITAMETLLFS